MRGIGMNDGYVLHLLESLLLILLAKILPLFADLPEEPLGIGLDHQTLAL